MNKIKLTSIVTLALGIQLLVSISLSSAALKTYYHDAILPGIFIEDVDVGGLNSQQAINKLKQELLWPDQESLLRLVGPEGQATDIRFRDIEYLADYDTSVNKALNISQDFSTWNNLLGLLGTSTNGHRLYLAKKFNKEKLTKYLNQLASRYNNPAQDAQLVINGDSITLSQDIKGRQLDIQETIDQLCKIPYNQYRLDLKFNTIEPEITASDYGINSRLAIYVTEFNTNNQNRSYNIQLASKLINNKLVKPGEVFSLNKALGPRTPESGYRQATVIIDNKLMPDYGGGVCQVATTLYNAVLLSELTVVERSPHTLPVPYAPVGKDATIAGDIIDFKFLNNTNYPVLITSQVQQGKLLVSIFGHKEGVATRLIKLETERSITKFTRKYVEETGLAPGQVVVKRPGRDGYQLKTYEVIVENGKVVERRLISQNSVQAETELIAIGPKVNTKGLVKK